VLGPYKPRHKPLACNLNVGGAIDPDGFYDPVSGNHYVVYKVDGNSLGRNASCSKYIAPTPLLLQQVEKDGVSLIGDPVELLLNFRYDGPNIKAPALVYNDDKYYLIHNSRCYAHQTYTVHYAVSYDGINGPYHKQPRPLLVTSQKINGVELHAPGGVDVDPSNSSRIVFHSDTNLDWYALKTFNPTGRNRALFAAELHFDADGLLTAKTFS
jgi:beta-xylosidase